MLKEIKLFYDRIKLREAIEEGYTDPPITHTKVFYKEYPRLPSIALPKQEVEDSPLEVLLEMRESHRVFSDEPIGLGNISQILRSCRIIDSKRLPERRTYPSGGARFPVEVYLLSFNVESLERGAYHYNLLKERLELLWGIDLECKRREIISPYLEGPAATIVFTSVLSRSEIKYGQRAYPYSLLEAGHMGQNILLKCSEIGVGACPVSGFVDDTLKEILDLTEGEIPIYTISLGKRKLL